MISFALEKLTFTVLLLDKISQPAKGVCKSIEQIQRIAQAGFQNISKCSSGMIAAGQRLDMFIEPARNFTKALDEVKSLDVVQKELDKLGAAGKKYAMQFGGNAADVVRSGYDIQLAIPGLAKGALAAFTYQGALLAKATKANVDTIIKYQRKMYKIFEEEAQKTGQAEWIEQLTGKTAYAVKMFKTSGNEISAAFANLGSVGVNAGIPLEEQLAVLGTLQDTMGGANAGAAYKAFLNGVGHVNLKNESGEILKFTDDSGKLLSTVEILEKIRTVVGGSSLNLADQTKLMQVFGDEGGKVVLNLLDKTENLKSSIAELNQIQDSFPATKMAEAMIDPYEQFSATLKTLQLTLGQTLLPAINLVLRTISALGRGVHAILELCPPLRWALAGIVLAFSMFTSIYGTLMAFRGIKKFYSAISWELTILYRWTLLNVRVIRMMTVVQKWNVVMQMYWQKSIRQTVLIQKLSVLWTAILSRTIQFWTFITSKAVAVEKLRIIWSWSYTKAEIAKNLVLKAGVGIMLRSSMALSKLAIWQKLVAASSWILSGGFSAASASVWAFTAALLANPVMWIVTAIGALVGIVVLVYQNFEKLNSIIPGLGDYLLLLLGPIGLIAELIKNWEDLPGVFTRIVNGIKTIYGWIAGKIIQAAGTLWNWIKTLWNGFKTICPNIANLLEKLFRIGWAGGKGFFSFWIETFRKIYSITVGIFQAIGNFFRSVWNEITAPVAALFEKIVGIGSVFTSVFSGITGIGGTVVSSVTGIFASVDGWIGGILRKLSKIPGLGFLDPDVSANGSVAPSVNALTAAGTEQAADQALVVPEVTAAGRNSRNHDLPAGGVRASSRINHWGGVRIIAEGGMSPGMLEEWALLQG